MEHLRIAIIGAGGTGMTMAADLTLRGCQVTLFEQEGYHEETMADLARSPTVELTGNAALGVATIHRVTRDIREALGDAELILVSAVANRHQELSRLMAPHLKNGQTVCFSSGNCASLLLKRLLGEKQVLVGELQGNIFPCRKIAPGKVVVAMPYATKGAAAFPAKDTEAFLASLSQIYPCKRVRNIFEATLNSPNLVIHLAATLANISKLESTPGFRLYRDGLTPGVFRLIEVMEQEKKAVMEGMGYTPGRAVDMLHQLHQPQFHTFRDLEGPDCVDHRYITEDAFAGVCLLASLAKPAGVSAPLAHALVAVASALLDRPYGQTGLTLANLGLEGLSAVELNRYLEYGA